MHLPNRFVKQLREMKMFKLFGLSSSSCERGEQGGDKA